MGMGLALGAVVLIAFVVLGVSLATFFIGVVALGVAIWLLRGREDGDAAAAEATPEEALPEWVAALQRMLELDLLAREKAAPTPVLEKIEQTLDDLRRLIPELNQAHAGGELTWTVNRMALDYMPRLVEPFLALDPGARDERQEEFMRSLVGLESEVANIEALVRDRKTGDFQSKAAFLRARFFETPSSD